MHTVTLNSKNQIVIPKEARGAMREPLKEKIKTTDNLIYHTVYKLYSLTGEEIGWKGKT